MANDDKQALRQRLESCTDFEAVLPTKARSIKERGMLRDVAGLVRSGKIDKADSMSLEDAKRTIDDMAERPAVGEIAESETMADQLADFADAGYNFVRVTDRFRKMSLAERSEASGAGGVTRVMRIDDTLLLETERINVRFERELSRNALERFAKRYGLQYLERFGIRDTARFIARDSFATESCLHLLDDDLTQFAEPEYIERIGRRYVPTDPEYASQWHHGIIQAPDAWDIARGDGATAAFIDNGFHVGHRDLNLDHARSGWFRSTPGDDDADFVAGTAGMPAQPHGTACASMLAAADNGVDGVGVAFNTQLRVIACLNDYYIGTQATLARALAFAVDPSLENPDLSPDDGADVVACSLGPNDDVWQMRRVLKTTLDDIAQYGRNGLGTPVFWACTNGYYEIKYDEVCSHPEVIVVGRSTRQDQDNRCGYGPELDFLAPGVDVHIVKNGRNYGPSTGTSYACPCAAGVAALMLSQDASLTAKDVRQRMRQACDAIGSKPYVNGRNDTCGFGRINALKSL